jgi:hypothetical protein
VPQIFSVFQRMNAETFFRQNEHLPFDRAERLQVNNAFELLRSSFPDCVKLESCVASSSAIGRLISAAESAIASNVRCDVLLSRVIVCGYVLTARIRPGCYRHGLMLVTNFHG